MPTAPSPSFARTCVAVVLPAVLGACGVRGIIRESLATEDPGRADGPVGPPPVDPRALAIAPPSLPPTEVPAIEPEPIHPRMDEGYRKRRLSPELDGGRSSGGDGGEGDPARLVSAPEEAP